VGNEFNEGGEEKRELADDMSESERLRLRTMIKTGGRM
jgi:hypothetical protein